MDQSESFDFWQTTVPLDSDQQFISDRSSHAVSDTSSKDQHLQHAFAIAKEEVADVFSAQGNLNQQLFFFEHAERTTVVAGSSTAAAPPPPQHPSHQLVWAYVSTLEKKVASLEEQVSTLKTDMDQWIQSHSAEMPRRKYRRKPKVDENAPEVPLTAYGRFCNDARQSYASLNLPFVELSKKIGQEWQNLASDLKEAYESAAEIDRRAYRATLALYRRTVAYQQYQTYLEEFQETEKQRVEKKSRKSPPKPRSSSRRREKMKPKGSDTPDTQAS